MPDSPSEDATPQGVFASLLAELRRRRVNRVAGLYLMGALAVIGYGGDILDNIGAPPPVAKWLTILVIAGFPVAVAAAWAYDLRVRRERSTAPGASYSAGARGAVILAVGILVGMGLLGVVALLSRDTPASAVTPASAKPVVGVLPIQLEGGEETAWLTRALAGSITDALSESRGVTMRNEGLVESYANLPLDSMSRALGIDYLVKVRLLASSTESRLMVQVLDTIGTLVGSAVTLRSGPPSAATAEELTLLTRDHVLHTLGVEVRNASWRFGTRSDVALNLLYKADGLVSQARGLMGQEGGARVAGGVLDEADTRLLKSAKADPKWTAPVLLRVRVAALRAYALRVENAPLADIEAALDTGIAISGKLLAREPANAQALALRGMLQHRKVGYLTLGPEENKRLLTRAEADLRAGLDIDGDMAIAAAELSSLLYKRTQFAEASIWAKSALALDAYLADADGITNRLAMATFEAGNDTAALRLCRDGVRRFGSAGHHGCVIEVLAFGDVKPDVKEAWNHLATLRADPTVNPPTLAFYEAQVAAVLARAGQRDSAVRVLERVRAQHAHYFSSPAMICLEAAVRFRLGQTDAATRLLRTYIATRDPDADFNLNRRALKPYRHLLAQTPAGL